MAPWGCKRLDCFPRAVGIILSLGMATVFIIAVLRRDVSPYVPFISETGAKPPESGIFSLFLDISATLGLVTVILRYMIVEECIQNLGKCAKILNQSSLAIGIASMMGMLLVAAYPMAPVRVAHGIGAFILFTSSLIYGFLHAWISYKMYPEYNSICICHTRLTLAILSALAYITNFISNVYAKRAWWSVEHDHWTGSKVPGEKGFDILVVSASSEWAMALLFIAYYFTFVKEFAKVTIHSNIRMLVTHFDEERPRDLSTDETTPFL